MGANMVRRLMAGKHECVVFDLNADHVKELAAEGAIGSESMDDFVRKLNKPRAAWVMVPAGEPTERTVMALADRMERGDVIIDGGNSYFKDDVRRSKILSGRGIRYLDVGTSGGIWGAKRGYCMMIGGDAETFRRLEPLFKTLSPGRSDTPPTPGREKLAGTAEEGYLHCGPAGAGHFVKMIHNGIEYGLMAAYAEGFNILKHANVGKTEAQATAEHAPLRDPQYYQFDFDLPAIAEMWRHGSVVSSWLLDLTAAALNHNPDLSTFAGRVSDSGEGRWTIEAAIQEGVPADVLSAALYARFTSRGEADFQNRLLSAMRFAFGGHVEQHT